MEVACSRQPALFGWHPQVAGASIKHNLKGLNRSSNTNLTIVLSIKIIVNLNFRIGVDVGKLFVWEEGFEGVHGLSDEGAVGHVGDEHFGLVGVADLVVHLDLLHAESYGQQQGDEEDCSHL